MTENEREAIAILRVLVARQEPLELDASQPIEVQLSVLRMVSQKEWRLAQHSRLIQPQFTGAGA